jgi:dihydrofolate reductase
MSDRVVCDISISADGYVAGPGQTADKPFGDGPVDRLHVWMFDTPDENQAEVDRVTAAGAFVMGRNMFGSIRGDWDPSWRGWWGEDPPYHAPVFVLTHHPRDPLPMQGGTTFRFVTDGIHAALEQARQAAGIATSPSPAARPRSTSTSPPASSTSSAPTSPQSSWGWANASSTGCRRCSWSSWPSGPRRSPPTSATRSSTEFPPANGGC